MLMKLNLGYMLIARRPVESVGTCVVARLPSGWDCKADARVNFVSFSGLVMPAVTCMLPAVLAQLAFAALSPTLVIADMFHRQTVFEMYSCVTTSDDSACITAKHQSCL